MADLLDAAGNPIVVEEIKPEVTVPEGHVLIKQEDWDGLGRRLDFLERPIVEAPPAMPAAPVGPSLDDQVGGMDRELGELNKQIDDAIKEEKPVSGLLVKRDQIVAKKHDVITDAKLSNVMNQGMETLQHLTSEVTQTKMPHLAVVKGEFDSILAGMGPEHKASPKAQIAAYDLACGRNMDKILEIEKEKFQRKDPATTQDVTEHSGRDTKGGDETPSFGEYFGDDAMLALKAKGQTPDEYAKRMGYGSAEEFVAFSAKQEKELEEEG